MFYTFFLVIFAFYALSSPLTKNQTLEAVFGFSDSEELKRMTANPQQWWEERKAQLFTSGRLKSHAEFVAMIAQQTKQRCQDLIEQLKLTQEWFCDLNAFEQCITNSAGEGANYAVAVYYTDLCDQLLFYATNGVRGTEEENIASREGLEQAIKQSSWADSDAIFRNKHMLWECTKDGLFSMVDYLIVLSRNFHLGSTFEDITQRDDFDVHDGLFQFHHGAFMHDAAHAVGICRLFTLFQQKNLDVGSYIQECFAQKNTSNIIELGQKILAAFINIHELTPSKHANIEKALFPRPYLLDENLKDILPFFMDASVAIDDLPDHITIPSEERMLTALESWRRKYLDPVSEQYLRKTPHPTSA